MMKGMTQEQKIRNRMSYHWFHKFYEETKDAPTDVMLTKVFELMNSYKAFHTATAAFYARDAMELLINDIKENNLKELQTWKG